ncbi:hypothetical protein WICPIJ_004188 [Wickerhamomyces pijperi]|uniref:Actin interacting protein 3 C-terminal domain-containing protein n=1 Tax=Wickerhamomyces pijperi TaxID=599730 RepID=A0A9P8Q8E0_WICPI|nr:hypothetical protein WICPIJ_004188 [Wickerhamomyces pijperi]
MNTIESSVTKLLVATKHLLESLTKWARLAATESDISDAYVQLGNEFKVACRAFINAGVDVSDLGDVPHSLRVVLEEALCEQPSQESLDRFLPNIREIIVTLLQNLKTKQALVRNIRYSRSKEQLRSDDSAVKRSNTNGSPSKDKSHNTSSPVKQALDRTSQTPKNKDVKTSRSERTDNNTGAPIPNTALVQLQKGDSLQRRASRRFSAYQYAKLTNNIPLDLPDQTSMLPVASKKESVKDTNKTLDPQGDSEITVFLKVGAKVKKATIPSNPSLTALRLLFVEKFAYSPGSGSFPDIYIKDNTSDISYELEEHLFTDIAENCVLSLNINENDQVIETLQRSIDGLKSQLSKKNHEIFQSTKDYIDKYNTDIQTKLDQISTSYQRSEEKSPPNKAANDAPKPSSEVAPSKQTIDSMRFELSVIKQLHSTNKSTFNKSLETLLSKINDFKSLSLSNTKSNNRQYMEDSHSSLSTRSDNLLTRFDDLQDLIEALRKDVATRGAKPAKKQLDYVEAELRESHKDFDELVGFISLEKPNWKKIWESELDVVCNEQQFLTLQEDLMHDLKEDFERAYETFELVKQCCEEQSKNPKVRAANITLSEHVDLPNLREALLSEVQSLKPNHESRVAAIERAEKLREKERLLTTMNGFEEELEGFVEDNKLKKSGGIEEVERLRKIKDEENLRSNFPPLF